VSGLTLSAYTKLMAYLDVTVEVYTLSLKESTKLKGLLEVVSSSAEFENIPIRRHEDALLRRVYDRVPVKLDRVDFDAPHFKTFLLLQAHFSRLQLPPDLAADQALVLEKVLNLLSACVDVMSSNAWLNATRAMDLSQMCVQAMWDTESPLKQVPHFEPDVSAVVLAIWSRIVSNVSYQVIKRCKEANVESVYDIMEMEDDQRSDLLRMDARQM
jgi:pre-mRNA-splicing helicase BRR2